MYKGLKEVKCLCGLKFRSLGKLRHHTKRMLGELILHAPDLKHANTAKSVKRWTKARKREEKANGAMANPR